jgi:hypothetical protein
VHHPLLAVGVIQGQEVIAISGNDASGLFRRMCQLVIISRSALTGLMGARRVNSESSRNSRDPPRQVRINVEAH